jgi:hypothetical protein
MKPRRLLIDLHAKREPQKLETCPGCGASLAWVTRRDLRRVHAKFVFRCRPGHEPRFHELRCRDCNRLLIIVETHDGGLSASHGRDALAAIRAAERDNALVLERHDGGDRDR